MAQFRIVAGELVSEEDFLDNADALSDLAASRRRSAVSLRDASISSDALRAFDRSLEAPNGWKPVPIAPGGPLTIKILNVYTGKYPVTGKKGMALLTSVDDDPASKAAARAINFLTKRIGSRQPYRKHAFEEGTNVVAHYGGFAGESLDVTIEMAFNDFPDQLVDRLAKGVGDVARLPVVLPYSGYLFLGGQLIKLLGDLANKFKDASAEFRQTERLNFSSANGPVSSADIRLVCRDGAQFGDVEFSWEHGLVNKSDKKPYREDQPYVILLIDGAERDSLKAFAPNFATAEMLKSFLDERDGDEVAIGAAVEAATAWSDLKQIKQANQALKSYNEASTPEAKARYKQQYNACIANIRNSDIQSHLKPIQ